MIEYKHQVFLERIVRPAHFALEGRQLYEWIEDQADHLSTVDGHRSRCGFGESYKNSFSIAGETVIAYDQNRTLSAGIRLGHEGHEISVRRVAGRDRRALIAHELGHALIFNNKRLWSRISRSRLLVDPLQERLVDDVARSLLVPRKAISQKLPELTSRPELASSVVAALADYYNVPIRLVLARLLRYLSAGKSAVIYATVPLQRELFAPRDLRPANRARTKWIIEYTPVLDRNGYFYPFTDFIPVNKALEPKGRDELPIFGQAGEAVDEHTTRLLVRGSDWRRLGKYSNFRTLALADVGEHRHLAILCT